MPSTLLGQLLRSTKNFETCNWNIMSWLLWGLRWMHGLAQEVAKDSTLASWHFDKNDTSQWLLNLLQGENESGVFEVGKG